MSSSRNHSKSSLQKKKVNQTSKSCLFCSKSKNTKTICFAVMINRALYSKFSSSQNYYYTKEINEILSNSRTPSVFLFKDMQVLDEDEEFLKRYYKRNEYDYKISMLTEYYKFHIDISRLFMMPITNIINKYHDKKRRIDYVRITRMLQQEEQNGKKKTEENDKKQEYSIENKILDFDFSEYSVKKKISISNTIQELNSKLVFFYF